MILPLESASRVFRLESIGKRLSSSKLKDNLASASMDITPQGYATLSLFSAFVVGFIVFISSFPVILIIGGLETALLLPFILALIFSLIFLFFFITYPGYLAKKRGKQIESELVFALRDMSLEVVSGSTFFSAIEGVGSGGYGILSEEFKKIMNEVNGGMSLDRAMEKLALETTSTDLKNIIFEINTSLKAGTSMEGTLNIITDDLKTCQIDQIKNYSQELSMLSLIYLLFAVVIPAIGLTFLTILSSFGGIELTEDMLMVVVFICIIIQVDIMKFMKSRRPMVY